MLTDRRTCNIMNMEGQTDGLAHLFDGQIYSLKDILSGRPTGGGYKGFKGEL